MVDDILDISFFRVVIYCLFVYVRWLDLGDKFLVKYIFLGSDVFIDDVIDYEFSMVFWGCYVDF